MNTAIVTIGDEILIGQIVDTNSAWIAQCMTQAGFKIVEMRSIGDDAQQIKNVIDDLFQRVDIILMTGGLGPTKDDITKKVLCEYFDTKLVFDQTVLDNIYNVVSNSAALNELTKSQALVPENCIILQNRVGTAPITWFERGNKVLVSMPGVPYEMRYVMENDVVGKLKEKYETDAYLKKVFIVKGYPESALAIHLSDFEDNLPDGFGLAYLPSLGLVKLRLFVRGEHRNKELEEQKRKLEGLLGNAIIAEEDIPLERLLGLLLKERKMTIGTAESCTGGNIAHQITLEAGSSAYFKGSIVSYADEEKINILHISNDIISTHGAVSEIVASEMAKNVKKILNVDCTIATTGIAGPDGGTDEIPIGTVYISTIVGNKHITNKYNLGKNRDVNITRATTLALLQIIDMLRDEE